MGNEFQQKMQMIQTRVWQRWQRFEDAIVPHRALRWAVAFIFFMLYWIRVLSIEGFYVVTYAMHLHLLYIAIVFVTPLSDPARDNREEDDGMALPSSAGDEFKPFVSKMGEFKAYRGVMRIMGICFFLTFIPLLDIPVFWPILLIYFVALFVSEMSGRIKHMVKFKYVPWSSNKPKYVAKDSK